MIKHSAKLTALALALGVSVGGVQAAEDSGFTVSPAIGYYGFDRDRNLEDDGFLSLGLGYQFASPWAVEVTYITGEANTEVGNRDIDFSHYRIDGLYHLDRSGAAQPYIAFGIGNGELEPDGGDSFDETQLNAGVGLKYFLTDEFALRGDLRFVNSYDEEATDVMTSVGLTYLFGGRKAAAAAPAKVVKTAADSDGDGVVDTADQCPNTPAGTEVDARGCMLDTDKDGVANAMDQCPDTSAGARVDAKGCYIVLKEKRSINLSVKFGNNSPQVPPQYYEEVAKVADFMREFPLTKLVIEGHTDSSGAASYNQSLSEKRAKAVADLLISKFGVDAARVSSVGYGESRPITENNTAAGRAENRRVVAVISADVEKIAK